MRELWRLSSKYSVFTFNVLIVTKRVMVKKKLHAETQFITPYSVINGIDCFFGLREYFLHQLSNPAGIID